MVEEGERPASSRRKEMEGVEKRPAGLPHRARHKRLVVHGGGSTVGRRPRDRYGELLPLFPLSSSALFVFSVGRVCVATPECSHLSRASSSRPLF